MKRRDFLKVAAAATLLKSFPASLYAKEPPVLAIAEGKDYAAITKNVIAAVGGIQAFVKKGDTVLVKPNIGWDRRPEFAATTHPVVVKTIVEECLRVGAKKVKVFDNPCNDMRRCYENSGIQPALKGMKDVDVKFMENERYKSTKINGAFLKEWELYDEALSANVIINIPIAKHHGLSRLTLGLKNMMGITGGNRGYFHRNMEDALCDLNSFVKCQLTLIDATRILTDHGPQGGSLKDVKILNKVVACADVVAADAFATTLFGLKPEEISTTVAAAKRGLGEMSLSKVKVVKA